MPTDLTRFVTAQDSGGTYATALAELRSGRKVTHWVWFVLPQVKGLGSSPNALRYALSGTDEAREYLRHPVLGPRLVECAEALLALPGDDPVAVMGGIDALKLRSSMTLFRHAALDEEHAVFGRVLDRYFAGADDPETVRRL